MQSVVLGSGERALRHGARRSNPGDDQDPGSGSVRRPLIHFLLSCLAALLVAGGFTALVSRNVATDIALNDVRDVTALGAERLARSELTDAVLAGDPAALRLLDDVVRGEVLGESLVRLKIWDIDGTIVYSDEPRLIGKRFELSSDELAVFNGAGPTFDVSDLSESENQFETEPRLLEVYVLSSTSEGTPLLFEAYFRYSRVSSISRQLWGEFAPIALGSLVLIEVVQIPLVLRLARRLRAGRLHRERLLSHAIESSNAERRRIAGDLHDVVVQELTSQWLSLAAAAKSSPDAHPQLQTSSEMIRRSVMSLRSLLVDIYPPNLFDEGLESALEDLVRQLRTRGISATLVIDGDVAGLSRNARGLIYRSAQEALRNVVAHAGATSVTVRVSRGETVTSLVVDDDGQGFPDGDSRVDGHFGLRALADLIADSGGQMVVRSGQGVGSSVRVEIPTDQHHRKGQQS